MTMTSEELERIKREAKIEAAAEIEQRIKKYYTILKGQTHPGMVTYYIEAKIAEYRKEIENEEESKAHGSDGD